MKQNSDFDKIPPIDILFSSSIALDLYMNSVNTKNFSGTPLQYEDLITCVRELITVMRDVEQDLTDWTEFQFKTGRAAEEQLREFLQRRDLLITMIESRAEYMLHVHHYDVRKDKYVNIEDILLFYCMAGYLGPEATAQAFRNMPDFFMEITKVYKGEYSHHFDDLKKFIFAYNQYWTSRLLLNQFDDIFEQARDKSAEEITKLVIKGEVRLRANVLTPVTVILNSMASKGLTEEGIIFASAWILPQLERFLNTTKYSNGKERYTNAGLKKALLAEYGNDTKKGLQHEVPLVVTEKLGQEPSFEKIVDLAKTSANYITKQLRPHEKVKNETDYVSHMNVDDSSPKVIAETVVDDFDELEVWAAKEAAKAEVERILPLLTEMERRVVELYGDGKTQKEVAVELGIGFESVNTYLDRIRERALGKREASREWRKQNNQPQRRKK